MPDHDARDCAGEVQENEEDLKDIFSFYSQLSRVVVVDSSVCMTEVQFLKFAVETGMDEEHVAPIEIEDIFARAVETSRRGLVRVDT